MPTSGQKKLSPFSSRFFLSFFLYDCILDKRAREVNDEDVDVDVDNVNDDATADDAVDDDAEAYVK